MPVSSNYVAIKGSVHPHPKDHRKVGPTASSDQLTVTLLLRRKTGAAKEAQIVAADAPRPTQEESANSRGADQGELDQVIAFAKGAGLEVVESDATRRSVVVRGSVADVDEARRRSDQSSGSRATLLDGEEAQSGRSGEHQASDSDPL